MKKKWLGILIVICMFGISNVCIGANRGNLKINLKQESTPRCSQEKTEQYQYNIASVSKTFTAVAVMQLVEQGKIDLDKPLTQYIPEFTMKDVRYKQITPRMLLNHTSGLMGSFYHNGTLLEDGNAYTHDKLLDFLKDKTLKAAPGTYGVYCNDGFTLCEILVEHVSGSSFSQYIEENICKPLHMENTTTSLANKRVQSPNAKNYLSHIMPIGYEGSSEVGSGGIKSTTEDLCKLGAVFMNEGSKILSPQSVKEISRNTYEDTTYLKVEKDKAGSFGLGLDSTQSDKFQKYGIQVLQKGGDLYFQHASLEILPEKNMAAAALSSSGSSTFNQLVTDAILMAALETKGDIPANSQDGNEIGAIARKYENIEACKIPQDLYDFAGIYAGTNYIEISFPTETTLRLRTINRESEITQEYTYTKSGWFVGKLGSYICWKICEAEDGETGISQIKLVKETDGKRYLHYNSHVNYAGLGMGTYSDVFGQKISPQSLSKKVKEAWAARENKYYYLSNEHYASAAWLSETGRGVRIKNSGVEGYISDSGEMRSQKILDENHSQTAFLCRDMSSVSLNNVAGVEYLSLDDYGMSYMGEEGLKPLKMGGIKMTEKDKAKWYFIPKSLAKKTVKITVKGKGAVYVYDAYHSPIFTTLALKGNEQMVLPEGGSLSFAGEVGSEMLVEQEA